MVAILTALYDEAYELIRHFEPEKSGNLKYYRGSIRGAAVVVYLTSPGIRYSGRLQKFLELMNPGRIILTGFAGALNSNLPCGAICNINSILNNNTTIHLGTQSDGYSIFSVPQPVITTEERQTLAENIDADLVDMEAGKLYQLLQSIGMTGKLKICKIIGDTFSDENFLIEEIEFRNFFSSRSNHDKWRIIKKTGILSSLNIYKRKRFLQKKLYRAMNELIQ